jgi:hypothetical protein
MSGVTFVVTVASAIALGGVLWLLWGLSRSVQALQRPTEVPETPLAVRVAELEAGYSALRASVENAVESMRGHANRAAAKLSDIERKERKAQELELELTDEELYPGDGEGGDEEGVFPMHPDLAVGEEPRPGRTKRGRRVDPWDLVR